MFVLVLATPACSGGESQQKEGAEADAAGLMADNHADQSPAMNEMNATGEVSMPEEVKQKATGDYVQSQSGETYATLQFKYNSGGDSDFTLSSVDGKQKVTGKAVGHDSGTFIYSDCDVTLTFDGNQFSVTMGNTACGGSNMDFNGVYSRK